MTSFDVLRQMKRILSEKKMGHTGTLDPLATGGLLVATWEYTKLISYIDKERKSYQATIMLDGKSASYDSDTEIEYISREKKNEFTKSISIEQLEDIFQKHFFGEILQIPPSYSALKIDGKRALERVRAGEDVEMKSRTTQIFSYQIIEFTYPKFIVELEVQAWTYIRSIAHDLWQILWCGGYISELRRTKVGSLDISRATTLEDLGMDSSLDAQEVFGEKIHIFHDKEIYQRLSYWQRIRWEFPFPENTDILLSDGELIRYAIEHKDAVLHPRKKII